MLHRHSGLTLHACQTQCTPRIREERLLKCLFKEDTLGSKGLELGVHRTVMVSLCSHPHLNIENCSDNFALYFKLAVNRLLK